MWVKNYVNYNILHFLVNIPYPKLYYLTLSFFQEMFLLNMADLNNKELKIVSSHEYQHTLLLTKCV